MLPAIGKMRRDADVKRMTTLAHVIFGTRIANAVDHLGPNFVIANITENFGGHWYCLLSGARRYLEVLPRI